MSGWNKYPPCISLGCEEHSGSCPSGGKHSDSWPELKGRNGEEAKAIIEKDCPAVGAMIIRQGGAVIENFCCNRVWVVVDRHGEVVGVPKIG